MPDVPPLVAEAAKKSGLLWVTVGDSRPVAAWHLWKDDRAYVVVGPGEQDVPGLAGAAEVSVTVRSADKGGRIVTWRATVTRVDPGGAEWDEVLPQLLAGRLNLPDQATARDRWAATAAVLRLEPTGELEPLPDTSGAAPPPPSPARTRTTVPRTIGRATRRRH